MSGEIQLFSIVMSDEIRTSVNFPREGEGGGGRRICDQDFQVDLFF